MNLGSMRTMVRDLLNEDTAAEWSDALINRMINRAAKEVYAQIITLCEQHFATSGNISYVSGTETYTLPNTGNVAKILLVERIDGTNKINLNPVPVTRKNDYQTQGIVLPAGQERYFLTGSLIGIAPVPTSSIANAITVWYIPPLADLGADGNTFAVEWTDLHHEVVAWGAFMRCLVRDKQAYELHRPHWERLWKLMTEDMQARQIQEPKSIVPVDDTLY